MNDTSPEIEKRFQDMMMAKTGVERLKMGCSMHQFAQKIVISSLPAGTNIPKALFLRFYKDDFNEEQCQKILAWLGRQA